MKLGVCDGDGQPRARRVVAFEKALSPEEMLDHIASAAESLVREVGPVRACGIGMPGQLDARRTVLERAINLPGWIDVPVPRLLSARLARPVILENDANCAAWGELSAGSGRGARSLVLFTLGTGVGGGIVLDGDLWTGIGGAAGALGHLVVDPAGPPCGCGQRGCLEQFASASAVARRFGRGSADEAFAAARDGNPVAISAVEAACRGLSIAVANMIHALQPEVVVIGGGMAAAGDALLEPVREDVGRRVRGAWLAGTRIELASLGDDAGWIGAALWAARAKVAR